MRFGIIFFMLGIVVMFTFFGLGKALYENDNTIDIYNVTNKMQWNSSLLPTIDEINETVLEEYGGSSYMVRVHNIVFKFVDTSIYIMFEVAKWGAEEGFKHPQWNYLWFARWLTIFIIVFIIVPVLPILLALIYLTYVGIRNVVRWFKRKKK